MSAVTSWLAATAAAVFLSASPAAAAVYAIDYQGANVDITGTITTDGTAVSSLTRYQMMASGILEMLDVTVSTASDTAVFDRVALGNPSVGSSISYAVSATEIRVTAVTGGSGPNYELFAAANSSTPIAYGLALNPAGLLGVDGTFDSGVAELVFTRVSDVPLPAGLALLPAGLGVLALYRRRGVRADAVQGGDARTG